MLDAGAAGTVAPVAGTLSGSTTLRKVKDGVSKDPPGLSPYLPPGHSQVALVVIVFLILVFVRILTDWLWGERHRVSRAQGGPWPPPSQGRQDRRRTLVLVAGHTVGCQESARGKSTQLRWAWALPGPSPWAPRPAYHHLSPAGKKACGGSLRGAAGIA